MSDNVIKFRRNAGSYEGDPVLVLEDAQNAGLSEIIVLGYDSDGKEYMISSIGDGGDILWLLERCKHRVLRGVEDI